MYKVTSTSSDIWVNLLNALVFDAVQTKTNKNVIHHQFLEAFIIIVRRLQASI